VYLGRLGAVAHQAAELRDLEPRRLVFPADLHGLLGALGQPDLVGRQPQVFDSAGQFELILARFQVGLLAGGGIQDQNHLVPLLDEQPAVGGLALHGELTCVARDG